MWISRIWRVVRKMFGYTEMKRFIGKDVALSQEMIDAINNWKAMMNGKADWINDTVKSLKIEQGICREFADVVLTELESSLSSEKLDGYYQQTLTDLNENLQDGLGLGSFILKPLGNGKSEFITADKFVPIDFDDAGKPDDCVFITVKRAGQDQYYTKVERHRLENGSLTIENTLYFSESRENIGRKVSLENVEEWAKLPEVISYPGMGQMDFGYYRNPLKNRVDEGPCGISIFDSATELIQKADTQAARLDWEYESGERAVHVDDRALRKNGSSLRMPKLKDRLYRGLNLDFGKDKELLQEYSPEMRDQSFERGLEKYYRQIEFNVGLAYGDLSDCQQVEKTATEIKVAKQRKYNRVNAIQLKLKDCLEDYAAALAFREGLYTSGYEFVCKFNDSILTDEETERKQDIQDVSMGAMQLWEYRMKWYGEDEETAKKNVAQQEVME